MPDKKQYILSSKPYGIHGTHFDGWYTGNTYQYQFEQYAICDTDINKVKKYSSLTRAEKAKDALNEKVVNYYFEVEELCPIKN